MEGVELSWIWHLATPRLATALESGLRTFFFTKEVERACAVLHQLNVSMHVLLTESLELPFLDGSSGAQKVFQNLLKRKGEK